ncbi:hypothetical protein ACFS3C_25175 [Azotobacter vinelandii]
MPNHQDTTGIGASSASGWQRKKDLGTLVLGNRRIAHFFGFLLEVFIYTTYKGTTGNILEEKNGKFWPELLPLAHSGHPSSYTCTGAGEKNSIRYSYWIALILGFLSYLIFTLTISSVELILSIFESGKISTVQILTTTFMHSSNVYFYIP